MDIPEYAESLVWKVPIVKNKKNPMKNYKKDQPENKDKFNNKFFGEYDGNWGFYTAENKIAIIDFDCRQNKKPKILKILNKNHNTLIIETKNGFHVYYKINGEFPNKTSHFKNLGYSKTLKKFYPQNTTKFGGFLEGIDVIAGTNVLVVGENSIINNHIYKAINKNPIKEINRESFNSILQSYLLKKPKRIRSGFIEIFKGNIDPNDLSQETGEKEFVYWKNLYIEALQVCKVEPEYLLDGLEFKNKGFDRNKTLNQIRSTHDPRLPENGYILTPEVYNKYFPSNKIRIPKKQTAKINKKEEHIETIVAKEVIERHQILTLEDSGEFTIYEKGKYLDPKICKFKIKKYINDVLKKRFPKKHLKANLPAIELEIKVRTLIDSQKFDANPDIINCLNGFYDIKKRTFTKHSNNKTLKTFIQIPINYDPNAECDAINKFLHEVVGEEFTPVMYAFIGYCMLPTVKHQKAVLLKGSGANGKSTLIDLIRTAVGNNNCSGVSLQAIGKRFQNVRMRGKLLNAVGDISNEKIKLSGPLKDAIAERVLTSDIKHYTAGSWINTTKHIFSCNEIPIPYDESFAFFRRWFLIKCINIFKGENKDPNMIDKITTPEELSGLLNKGIEGIARLEKEGGFDDDYTEWVKKNWLEELHPFEEFFQNEMFLNSNYWCDKQEFIKQFNKYWENKGYKPLLVGRITGKLYYEGIKQVKGSRRAESGQEYQGMSFKDDVRKIKLIANTK